MWPLKKWMTLSFNLDHLQEDLMVTIYSFHSRIKVALSLDTSLVQLHSDIAFLYKLKKNKHVHTRFLLKMHTNYISLHVTNV